jgi:hypothetical protein
MNQIERVIGERTTGIARAVVVDVRGAILVRLGEAEVPLRCDVLHTSEKPLLLVEEDDVLVWRSDESAESGLILGRIGRSHADLAERDPTPDELLLEAKHSLTLRVGDGSITIREDGKILIKGKDLVSHAQRMNRIKGGAVSIN